MSVGPEASDVAVSYPMYDWLNRRMETHGTQEPTLRRGRPLRLDLGGILEVNKVTDVINVVELLDAAKRRYHGQVEIPLQLKGAIPIEITEAFG